MDEALRHRRLTVVGDPGAGKSTFARHVAYQLAESLLRVNGHGACKQPSTDCRLPALIRVADLLRHREAFEQRREGPASPTAPRWIPHYLGCVADDAALDLDEAFFRELIEAGNCLVILDGLDEAATDEQRISVARLAEQASVNFEKCPFVVTTRPAAYKHEVVLAGFAQAQIAGLDKEAIDDFLQRWCDALFADSPSQAKRHLEELQEALGSRLEIRRLARNPVMLTALAVVHWNEKRIPEQRTDLYESIISWLSRARPRRSPRLPPERCVSLMQQLALAMQDAPAGRRVQVPRRYAADVLAPQWRELAEDQRLDAADRFLADEEVDSGIIVGRGDQLRFWHLTFQEYLAARGLAAIDDQRRRMTECKDKLYSTQWREAILLLAGVLYRQGVERVDEFVSSVIDQLGRKPSLVDQAQCVGLLGAAVHDLSPVDYRPSDPRYASMLDAVLGVFDADYYRSSHSGNWRSRILGVFSSQWSRAALVDIAISAANALGQAGDPRFLSANLPNNWVTVPAGRLRRKRDEHPIALEEYQVGRFPVTVGEFCKFVASGCYKEDRFWGAGGFGLWEEPKDWDDQLVHPNWPVVGVSWYEASAYCVWAQCRLLTDAEWEFAAAGAEGRKYPWGPENPDASRANCGGRVGHPTPVGAYPLGATPEGVCDMGGNVLEWCSDASSSSRVIRGGSWDFIAEGCSSAYRFRFGPVYRCFDLGFRLARSSNWSGGRRPAQGERSRERKPPGREGAEPPACEL